MYEYKATVCSVHDGDTIRVDIDCGFDVWLFNQPLRLVGIQAPELGTPGGSASRDWLRDLLPVGKDVTITTLKDAKEKYGRYLALVFLPPGIDGTALCLNDAIVDAGHAVHWDGTGPRPSGN